MSLFLSRLTLSRAPSVEALKRLIDPQERSRATDAHHRLLWSAFAGDADASRDFLWRSEGNGRFFVLSHRRPADSPFFDPPEVKEFTPALAPGDRLDFILRANATRTVETGRQTARGKPHKSHIDLVMDALHTVPSNERASQRMHAAQAAAHDWLRRQGERHGFEPVNVAVEDYSVRALPGRSGPRKNQPQFGVLDITGHLAVTDPRAFVLKVTQGFGRAKAFGCGLMLIRRG